MSDKKFFDYIVVTRNKNTGAVNLVGIFISLATIFVSLNQLLTSREADWLIIIFTILVTFMLIRNIVLIRKGHEVNFLYAALLAGIIFFRIPSMAWLGVAIIAVGILEKFARKPLEIGFSSGQIVFNTLIRRKIRWSEVSNVVLKDGLLTIDFKNNRLFQSEVLLDDEWEAGEEEFNQWAKERVNAE